MDFVCDGVPHVDVPGADTPSFPAPLLPNGGAGKLNLYGMDILVRRY
jgi:hypothetical protein